MTTKLFEKHILAFRHFMWISVNFESECAKGAGLILEADQLPASEKFTGTIRYKGRLNLPLLIVQNIGSPLT